VRIELCIELTPWPISVFAPSRSETARLDIERFTTSKRPPTERCRSCTFETPRVRRPSSLPRRPGCCGG
jgi:hypothetical protein